MKERQKDEENKKKSKLEETVGMVYWPVVLAAYLSWSFLTNDWHITWLCWPIAGVLFAPVMALCDLFARKKD